jgi:lactoylglutathione lyase
MTPLAAADRLFEAHLIVADLDASIAFYRDRLGLELAQMIPARRVAFFWIGLRGTSLLGLWEGGAGPQKTTSHIAFATAPEDVIAAPKALDAVGIVALDFDGHPTNEPVVLAWMPAVAVYFVDPDGHLLEYIAMLDSEPRPDDGVVTWGAWTRAADSRHAPGTGARNKFARVRYL